MKHAWLRGGLATLVLLAGCAGAPQPPGASVQGAAGPAPVARADALERACARPARPLLVTTRLTQGDRGWPGAPTGSEMNTVVAETNTYREASACP